MTRILLLGGYGVFGRLLAAEVLRMPVDELLLAGRDPGRASAACKGLDNGGRTKPLVLDLGEAGALERAAASCFAVLCTAGPFQGFPRGLPGEALRAGAHWLDIADEKAWVEGVLGDTELDRLARDTGRLVGAGLSTVPALAGLLLELAAARLPDAESARVTLLIGNRNRKGAGAIESLLATRPSDPVEVAFPGGRRVRAYRFDAPLDAEFRVAFELRGAGRLLLALARLSGRTPPLAKRTIARGCALAARLLEPIGTDEGCLLAEVRDSAGTTARVFARGAGQRMAVLPCAVVLGELLRREPAIPVGCAASNRILPLDRWQQGLRSLGLDIQAEDG